MQDGPIPELLRRASVILAQEIGRTPSKLLDGQLPQLAQQLGITGAPPAPALTDKAMQPGFVPSNPLERISSGAVPPGATSSCPVTGASMPSRAAGAGDLQAQAHELLSALLSLWKPGGGSPGNAHGLPVPSLGNGRLPFEAALPTYPGRSGPALGGPELPTFPGARDQLRRKAHELIETLLITFNEATGEKGLPAESQVPLVTIAAPVAPGETARVSLTVANEEGAPLDVSLYSTNFVADHGHELPSLRVTILPRTTVIPAQGQVTFEVSIAVPQQTLKGSYCGLIQAQGSRYFKAVLALDVL